MLEIESVNYSLAITSYQIVKLRQVFIEVDKKLRKLGATNVSLISSKVSFTSAIMDAKIKFTSTPNNSWAIHKKILGILEKLK